MERLTGSEERMIERLTGSEERMMERLTGSEERMMERLNRVEERNAISFRELKTDLKDTRTELLEAIRFVSATPEAAVLAPPPWQPVDKIPPAFDRRCIRAGRFAHHFTM